MKRHALYSGMALSLDLQGKAALVTGASRGIGRAVAVALAQAGARVFLVARTEQHLKQVEAEIVQAGGSAAWLVGDVADPAFPREAVGACTERLGGLDILVNNAGISNPGASADYSFADWEQILRVNLTAPFLFSQAAAEWMMNHGGGRIIQMASMFGLSGEPGLAAYCATKGGLIQLTRSLAIEWARYNIQVNAVAPGYFETDMIEAGRGDAAVEEAMLRKIPSRRFGNPEELGPLCVYLASGVSGFMTGEVIVMDGGQSAR